MSFGSDGQIGLSFFWVGTGLVLAYKRLEEQSFIWLEIRDGLMRLYHAQFEALFVGHVSGTEICAIIDSLIETSNLKGNDLHAWLAGTLKAIVNGNKQSDICELLPWI